MRKVSWEKVMKQSHAAARKNELIALWGVIYLFEIKYTFPVLEVVPRLPRSCRPFNRPNINFRVGRR